MQGTGFTWMLTLLLGRMCRVFVFLNATSALAGRCVEFSSMVSPAVRAAHLAAFRTSQVQVTGWNPLGI
jgi:hypothetical protein